MLLPIVLAGFAVLFGLTAMVQATRAMRTAEKTSHRRCKAAQAQMRTDLTQAEDTIDRLSKALRKMQMRQVAAKRHAQPLDAHKQQELPIPVPELTPEQWKKQQRLKLHNQQFKNGA